MKGLKSFKGPQPTIGGIADLGPSGGFPAVTWHMTANHGQRRAGSRSSDGSCAYNQLKAIRLDNACSRLYARLDLTLISGPPPSFLAFLSFRQFQALCRIPQAPSSLGSHIRTSIGFGQGRRESLFFSFQPLLFSNFKGYTPAPTRRAASTEARQRSVPGQG